MNFELTEAQEEIVRQVRTLCTNFPDEYWRDHDRRAEFPHDFFDAVAAAGYLGSMFFGGMILRASRGGAGVPVAYALLTLLLLGAAVTVIHDSYSRTFSLTLAGIFIFLGLIAPLFIGGGTGYLARLPFDIDLR